MNAMSATSATLVQDIPAEACWDVFEAINAAWLRSASGWPRDYLQNMDRFVDVAQSRCDKLPDELEFHEQFRWMALHFYDALYKRRELEGTLPAHWPRVPWVLAARCAVECQRLDKRPYPLKRSTPTHAMRQVS
jgi:hypothetical protein